MLSDPKRLKTPGGYGYLISWKHKLRVESEAQAHDLAKRILADPYNASQIRAGLGRPSATLDELEEWLATGLAAKALVALKTKPCLPVFDRPQETDLFDLLPPEEPKQELESLSFEVTELEPQGPQGVEVRYRVTSPSDSVSGGLPAGERRAVNNLERSSEVVVELSAVHLSLLERWPAQDEDRADDQPAHYDDDGRDTRDVDGDHERDHGVAPRPDLDRSTMVSLVVEVGSVEALEAPVPLGPDPSACGLEAVSFSKLVLSLRERVSP